MAVLQQEESLSAAELNALLHGLLALKRGRRGARLPLDWSGVAGKVADAFNDVVELNERMAGELSRLSRTVGKEGRLGQRLALGKVDGFWEESVESVNELIDDLVHPTREMARVIGGVAQGDLSQTMALEVGDRPLQGEFLLTARTINRMVDQLRSFASEVTRVAREVGTEGKLGGQAQVKDVAGTWKDLTESVNSMASNLTSQVRNIADITKAVAAGDLSKKITVDVKGEVLELKDTINTMVDQLRSFASEVTRVAREVGTDGKLGGQAVVQGVAGTWKDLTDSVNFMASNLTAQVRNIADVTKAVAAGDLSKKITVDVKGEILELKNTVNTMVDQLRSFAAEVTRVAREVGTEGKLGGQAQVEGVSGTWKDLTESVNFMAANLTAQVRGIAKVVTAVANGDLKRKLTVEAKGEIAELAETINEMTDTLATFADQVTTVAREVGVEGQLGGQAKVPGAAGTWKALTENVNQLAANLTTQVRAIAEVATAVTKGDLTRSITVGAQGEVAALKDTINEMIRNLRDTTQKNTEQDWLKTNLAKFSRMLQGQRDLTNVGRMVLSELCPVVNARQAEIYVLDASERQPQLRLLASYASEGKEHQDKRFALGEGVIGQCAVEKEKVELNNVPPDYFRISSGLGGASPRSVLVLPLVFEGQVRGVLELASFQGFNPTHQAFLDQLTESIGIVLNTIEANMRTEDLLKQSQSLAQQLQTRQEELQKTNEALQEKAHLLAKQNEEVERKNAEVEQARQELEEKARQLALTSKYKSEFLANMSHELRTPLNSLLILSDQLSKNPGGNLTPKQTEFAKTIHSSGNDLLNLINDILDLSKIESGTVQVDVGELRLDDMRRFVERTFRHVAESKGVEFSIEFDPQLPSAMQTDAKRLQQIIKNLLSNAFKFTHRGSVSLSVYSACDGWSPEHDVLGQAPYVLAFEVADTGIGISTDKQHIIFEAFQQADGSTSRKYGGTGLGLAISRELSRLLGGEIKLVSSPGAGSTFTLYVPQNYSAPRPPRKSPLAESVLVEAAKAPALVEAGRTASPPAARRTSATGRASDRRRQRAPAGNGSPRLAEPQPINEANDDRDNIQPGDRVLLIVENDMRFAGVLLDAARQQGMKGLVATRGAAALALARDYSPQAVTLDIYLPDIEGWRVLERLKGNLATRHLPVCVISTDEARRRALGSGAIAFLAKPIQRRQTIDSLLKQLHDFVSRPSRQVLVVEPDAGRRETIARLATADDVRVITAGTEQEALQALEAERPDCLVMSPELASLAARLSSLHPADGDVLSPLPVIVYGKAPPENGEWNGLAESCTVRCATSPEQLVDLLVLFTHRTIGELAEDQRQMLAALYDGDRVLAGKKALIVDDDMRNIFALTTVLEEHAMDTLSADNGRDAIELLKANSGIDIVLMDIMMPELDGIETIRIIRRDESLKDLPIVAVTAKAMKGDREKCIEAGAWDYLAKPVDTEQLLAVLRAWLRD